MASMASRIEAPPVVESTIKKRGFEERARASSSASCDRARCPRPRAPRPPTLSDVPAAAIATLPRNDRRPGDFNGLVCLFTADSSVEDVLERRGDHEAGKDRPVAGRGGAA